MLWFKKKKQVPSSEREYTYTWLGKIYHDEHEEIYFPAPGQIIIKDGNNTCHLSILPEPPSFAPQPKVGWFRRIFGK